jgi:hypothetical protein
LDNPIADAERPLEVLRTIHSFDPCLVFVSGFRTLWRRNLVEAALEWV